MKPVETFTIQSERTYCDGGASGHPRVFLNLMPTGQVVCPYCSRQFVLAQNARSRAGH